MKSGGGVQVREIWQGIQSLVLASHCLGCRIPFPGGSESPLCLNCLKRLPWSIHRLSPPGGRTGFDQAICPFSYKGLAKELIMALKYHGRLSVAPLLGKLLAQTLTQRLGPDPADGIVPIPLHPTRIRERGFNQALVLAQVLAKRLRLSCRKDLLIRHRPTEPQAGLCREERLANVRDAFRLHPDPWVRLKRILLVDDVYTTGATAEACAKLLKQAGAQAVTVAAIAHG